MSDVLNANSCLDRCVDSEAVDSEAVRSVAAAVPSSAEVEQVAKVFKLLGDPTRVRLLYALLEGGQLCVCDLAVLTGATQATVSQALRHLRASTVVSGRRQGRNIYYRLHDAHVRLLLDVAREHVLHSGQTPSGEAGRS